MEYIFFHYPKCSTSAKAKKWLDDNNVEYKVRHMKDENPTYDELKVWVDREVYPLKSFFNTSGLVYKDLKLKEKLTSMSKEEQIRLLSTNGMLVKRPIVVSDDLLLVGFKEDTWKEKLGK